MRVGWIPNRHKAPIKGGRVAESEEKEKKGGLELKRMSWQDVGSVARLDLLRCQFFGPIKIVKILESMAAKIGSGRPLDNKTYILRKMQKATLLMGTWGS